MVVIYITLFIAWLSFYQCLVSVGIGPLMTSLSAIMLGQDYVDDGWVPSKMGR